MLRILQKSQPPNITEEPTSSAARLGSLARTWTSVMSSGSIVWMPLPWRPYSRFGAATPMAVPIPTPAPTPTATHAPMIIRGDLTHLTHLPDFPGPCPPYREPLIACGLNRHSQSLRQGFSERLPLHIQRTDRRRLAVRLFLKPDGVLRPPLRGKYKRLSLHRCLPIAASVRRPLKST